RLAAQRQCEFRTVTGGVTGLVGQALVSFNVDLDMSNYFLPVFVRLYGWLASAPDTSAVWKMTSVRIGKIPQECFDESPPTPATNVQGVWSSSWDHFHTDAQGNPRSGVRVRWGAFSRSTLSQVLTIGGYIPQV